MIRMSPRRALVLAGAAALAVPAIAAAHPGVYTVVANTGTNPAGQTFLTNPTPTFTTQTQYVVANDGYAVAFREDNGDTTSPGIVNYKALPSAWRAPMTAVQILSAATSPGIAYSSLQPHATCLGVAALTNPANIRDAWGRVDNQPFFNYIPWQKTTAGLGDNPADWIPDVKTLTGVDLSTLNTVAEFTTACTNLGGTYLKADSQQNAISTAQIADAVAPVQAQVTSLTTERDSLKTELAAAKAAGDAAKTSTTAAQAEIDRLLRTLPASAALVKEHFTTSGARVKVTGPANRRVTVQLKVSGEIAKEHGLRSRVIGSAVVKLSSKGLATVTVRITKDAKAKIDHDVDVTVGVASSRYEGMLMG